jgi:DNA-binding HxlR family transcriptional regulator
LKPTRVGNTPVFEADYAPRRVMDLFTVKWTSMVIHALYHWPGGKCRAGALQRSLPGIPEKMLVQTLREMDQRGFAAERRRARAASTSLRIPGPGLYWTPRNETC